MRSYEIKVVGFSERGEPATMKDTVSMYAFQNDNTIEAYVEAFKLHTFAQGADYKIIRIDTIVLESSKRSTRKAIKKTVIRDWQFPQSAEIWKESQKG